MLKLQALLTDQEAREAAGHAIAQTNAVHIMFVHLLGHLTAKGIVGPEDVARMRDDSLAAVDRMGGDLADEVKRHIRRTLDAYS